MQFSNIPQIIWNRPLKSLIGISHKVLELCMLKISSSINSHVVYLSYYTISVVMTLMEI